MKPADRPHALARLDQLTRYTLDHLTTAHTEAHRQARATANLGSGSDGRAPKGSHSDPTGSAVTTMADAIARADETSRLLDDDLDTAIAALTRLTTRTTTILRNSLRPNDEPAPVQAKRVNCANCARFGLDIDVAEGSNRLCGQCKSFRQNHGVMAHEAICRAWAAGTNRITPGLIAEAKAHARARRTRSRRAS